MSEEAKVEVTPIVEATPVAEVKKMSPMLFTKPDERIKIEIDVLFDKDTGEIINVLPIDLSEELLKFNTILGQKRISFIFNRPGYQRMNMYRERAAEFNKELSQTIVNNLKIRNYYFMFHLKDWTMTDENEVKIPLKFDPNGALSDESLELIYKMNITIVDTIVALYEKKLLLRN